jgi:hypothetical protein
MEENDKIEAALRSLSPAAVRVDAVAAAYAAGRGRARVWRAATVMSLMLCAAAWVRPHERVSDVSVATAGRTAEQPVERPSELSVICLQEAVLRDGMEGLPKPDVASTRAVNIQGLY